MIKDLESFEQRINISTELYRIRSRLLARHPHEGRSMSENSITVRRNTNIYPRRPHPRRPNQVPASLSPTLSFTDTIIPDPNVSISPGLINSPRILQTRNSSPEPQSTPEAVRSSDEEFIDLVLPPLSPLRNPIIFHRPKSPSM